MNYWILELRGQVWFHFFLKQSFNYGLQSVWRHKTMSFCKLHFLKAPNQLYWKMNAWWCQGTEMDLTFKGSFRCLCVLSENVTAEIIFICAVSSQELQMLKSTFTHQWNVELHFMCFSGKSKMQMNLFLHIYPLLCSNSISFIINWLDQRHLMNISRFRGITT